MLVSVVGSTTAPGGHSGLMEESLTRGEHTGRQNVATSPDSAQKRPNGSKWHIFAFTKCKGKLGSLNPFKSCFCVFTCCFFYCSLPPTKCPFRLQVSFRVPGVWYAKKTPVHIQPKHAGENIHQMPLDLRKTRAEWRNMLQNMLPHPTPGERDSFLMFFLFVLVPGLLPIKM